MCPLLSEDSVLYSYPTRRPVPVECPVHPAGPFFIRSQLPDPIAPNFE